ncbi:MAG: response regulator [Phaeospirillum sp.]|nr:response regulator [Phaeospirillum sp.]
MTHQQDDAFNLWISGKTFMVIEDVTSSRMLEAGLLRSLGAHKVLIATDGNDAVTKLSAVEHAPDIIICDWIMPGMDGIGVLEMAKARYPTIKFVMLTAKSDAADMELAKSKGVDDYIVKPFSRDTLMAALKRLSAD